MWGRSLRRAHPQPDTTSHDVVGLMPARETKRVSTRAWLRTCSSPKVYIRCLRARAGSVLAPRSNDRWRLVLIRYFARPRPAIDFALGAGKGLPLRARGWRKQKRWINGRSGDQAEALGDRAAACLLARRCKHHGVAGVRSIAMEIADARAIRTIPLEKCDCPAGRDLGDRMRGRAIVRGAHRRSIPWSPKQPPSGSPRAGGSDRQLRRRWRLNAASPTAGC
jgi:hypothetical protein